MFVRCRLMSPSLARVYDFAALMPSGLRPLTLQGAAGLSDPEFAAVLHEGFTSQALATDNGRIVAIPQPNHLS